MHHHIKDGSDTEIGLLGYDVMRLTAMAVAAMRHLLDISGADSNPIPRCLGIARLINVRFVSNLFLSMLIAVAGAWLFRSSSRKLGFLIIARFERLARPAVMRTASLFSWPRALAPSGITRGLSEASS